MARPTLHFFIPCTVATLLFAGAGAAQAQTNDEINTGIQFNFSKPGARSLGLGGAFLALADDATAAYSNPAGLTNLTFGGTEVSFELRRWRHSILFTDGGHSDGAPIGVGIDTVEGLREGESASELSGFSFLSVGYVLPRGVTLAVYWHQLAKFENTIESQGPLVGSGDSIRRVRPTHSTIDLGVENLGVSVAYEFGHSISVGAGLSYYDFSLSSLTERFDVADRLNRAQDRDLGGFFGPADLLGDNVYNTQLQEGSDSDWGFNLGLLWKFGRAPQRWSLGAAYQQGPDFSADSRYVWGPKAAVRGQGANGAVHPLLGGPGVFHVPDSYGVGIAYAARNDRTKLALDYDRIRYSQLTDDLVNILLRAGTGEAFHPSDFRVKDANEVHVGFEYVFLAIPTQLVSTLRLGAWHDPAHKMEFLGSDEVLRARFRPGEDDLHLSVGVGLVIKENFQVDSGFDFSDRVNTAAISIVKFL